MNHTKDARRIGLVDVDGHNGFPNLALMRISAWHKALGDMVEWWDGMLPYDRIYMSKVFTFSPDNDTVMQSDEIIRVQGLRQPAGGNRSHAAGLLDLPALPVCCRFPYARLYPFLPVVYRPAQRGRHPPCRDMAGDQASGQPDDHFFGQ